MDRRGGRGAEGDDDGDLSRFINDPRFRAVPVPTPSFNNSSSSLIEAFDRMNLACQLQEPPPQVVGNNSRPFQPFPYPSSGFSTSAFNNTMHENHHGVPMNHHYSWGDSFTPSGNYFASPSVLTNSNHRINSLQGSQTYNGSYYGHVGRPYSMIQNVLSSGNYVVSGSSCYNTSYPSLEHLKGRVVREANDQVGHVSLVQNLNTQNLEWIFLEIKDHVLDLVVHQFGHRVMEKVFKLCSKEQMNQLIHSLTRTEQFYGLCIHPQGSRTLQKLIECVTCGTTGLQRSLLVSALRYITVSLSKNHNGHHVIQQCLDLFPVRDVEPLVVEIAKNCVEVSMDKSGCCVVQKSLDRAQGEHKQHILIEISRNALILSEHSFGNYVVQLVLQKHIPYASSAILNQLTGNFVSLSRSKFGSNVVEKCLKECGEDGVFRVVNEILQSRHFLDILTDAYGNFVAQTALDVSKGNLHYLLQRRINEFKLQLLNHPFGTKVLEKSSRKNFRKQGGLYMNMYGGRSHAGN